MIKSPPCMAASMAALWAVGRIERRDVNAVHWSDDPSFGALLACFCSAVWIYSSKHIHTSVSICKSFNEHASSYPSVSFSLCASLRFKVLIIFAVVFFLSSRRRTEVSPQGSLNFHPQSLKQRSEGFINSARHLILSNYYQHLSNDTAGVRLLHAAFTEHFVCLRKQLHQSEVFYTEQMKKKKKKKNWTLGRVYLIFSQRYVSLICFILSCQAYRQLRRKMRTWRKKVAKRRSREIEHKRWRKKGKVLKLMKDVDEEEDETNSWFLLQKLRSRSTLRYWWVKLLEDADY